MTFLNIFEMNWIKIPIFMMSFHNLNLVTLKSNYKTRKKKDCLSNVLFLSINICIENWQNKHYYNTSYSAVNMFPIISVLNLHFHLKISFKRLLCNSTNWLHLLSIAGFQNESSTVCISTLLTFSLINYLKSVGITDMKDNFFFVWKFCVCTLNPYVSHKKMFDKAKIEIWRCFLYYTNCTQRACDLNLGL